MIIIFKALDVIITKYGLDNNLMREMNPYYSPSVINQLPVIIFLIAMMWLWLKKDVRMANRLMLFFAVVFFYPVVNNAIIIYFF